MKLIITVFFIAVTFFGCSKEPKIVFDDLPETPLVESGFDELPQWRRENYVQALDNFINSCVSKRTQKIYKDLCSKASETDNAKEFLEENFTPYSIDPSNEGLLTGYYEPELKGSLTKTSIYKYPVYTTPKDLIIVDLSSIYPDLKHYRLRGKLKGNKVVPYKTRAQTNSKHIESEIICYVDSKVDLFFLEVQGSGRVTLEDGTSIFIGYANQNGHRYRSIGKYLVNISAIKLEDISLQSIEAWLEKNPSRVDEVLNHNESVVFFEERKQAATGSLGLELTGNRSIAVDRKYIPLGTMIYLSSKIDDVNVDRIVFAQDTGGAIKGTVRADMFLGFGEGALESAGKLKSPLKLWMLLPKDKKRIDE